MKRVLGYITCNYSTMSYNPLEEQRPLASLPFAGRYRLLDFALSNMVNAGIRKVGMVMPTMYRSVVDHVEAGQDWGLNLKRGGLFLMPGTPFGTARSGGRFLLRDILNNRPFFVRNDYDYAVFSSANFVYNVDLKAMIEAHKQSDADITVLTQTVPEGREDPEVLSFEIADGLVSRTRFGAKAGDTAFLDCFVIGREKLRELVRWYSSTDYWDIFQPLNADTYRVKVKPYYFEGYAAPIFSMDEFYHANMDMLNPDISSELFPADRSVKTKTHDTSPAKHEVGSKVSNALISAGCRIYGEVTNSVLGRNVIIEPGAQVSNSIIMQGAKVGADVVVDYAIVDRNNEIPAGMVMKGTPQFIFYQEKHHN
ncbi:MAG: glucose-1-phosphate adenylyltransferase subunit GlgD [Coriobacteriia bacterium]|nr:glucose-1-phosphate adenylyltransferase subunit GlgD [Coriobacteriia bacterium]